MSNPKMLNLDDLVAIRKFVVIDFLEHDSVEMSVDSYLAKVKRAQQLEAERAGAVVSNIQKIDDAVEFISEMFPTIPAERVRKMSMRQLSALITFAMAAPDDIIEGVANAAEAQAQAPAPEPTETAAGNVLAG